MTNHYEIHLVKTKTDFQLTYRDGKFQNLKRLRGAFTTDIIKYFHLIFPPQESDLDAFITAMKGRVIYTAETKKAKSILQEFESAWFGFFRKEDDNGLAPKYDGADCNALKKIINYLKSINNGNEVEALVNWKLILDNWSVLSDFHKKQTDLKYINSKLNVIIREIIREKGSNTSKSGRSVSL